MADSRTDVIAADALNITKFTSLGSAVGGVVAAAIAALGGVKGWPLPMQGALLGLAAIAVVVAGAVVVADMRTRAYLAARVVPTSGTPVLVEMWRDLIKAAPSLERMALRATSRTLVSPNGKNGSHALPVFSDEELGKLVRELVARLGAGDAVHV